MNFTIKSPLNPRNLFIKFNKSFTSGYKLIFYRENYSKDIKLLSNIFFMPNISKIYFLNSDIILSRISKEIPWEFSKLEAIFKNFLSQPQQKNLLKIASDKNSFLDLSSVECPFNYIKIRYTLKNLDKGSFLEVIINEGKAYDNAIFSLKEEGFFIQINKYLEEKKQYKLTIKNK